MPPISLAPGGLRLGAFLLILGALYYSTFEWLVTYDWQREDYNYGYLIPLLVLYLLWEKKELLKSTPSSPSWWGLFFFLPGILFFWFGELAGEFFTLYLSSWFLLVGFLWMHLGFRKLNILAFPLLVALFMFPPPNFLNTKLTSGLKLISSQIGVALIQLYGMSAYREGNLIDLGFTQLQVVDACSGLRFFFPLIIMGVLLAYFYRTGFWKGALISLSAVPLSVIMNSLRIAMTGVLYQHFGAEVAEGFFHGFSGWLIFMISFAVLFFEIRLLKRFLPDRGDTSPKKTDVPPMQDQKAITPPAAPFREWSRMFTRPPQFLLSLGLVILTLAISQGIEFREKTLSRKPFNLFPVSVGQWSGTRQFLDREIVSSLDLTDYVIMEYGNGSGESVNFYAAYYASQRKGESIHSPETCLPASGWTFQQAGTAAIPLPSGGSLAVNRAVMEKGSNRQLVYFWFPARGRILTNAYELKLYGFWDALTRQRTDAALVRVITPVRPGETLDSAADRLQNMVLGLQPVLKEFIPH